MPVLVIKSDGRREQFDVNKLKRGIIISCEKCSVSMSQIDAIVDKIRQHIQNQLVGEISTDAIGELVMKHLKSINEVAYIRFVSVYRKFTDVSSFMQELQSMQRDKENKK